MLEMKQECLEFGCVLSLDSNAKTRGVSRYNNQKKNINPPKFCWHRPQSSYQNCHSTVSLNIPVLESRKKPLVCFFGTALGKTCWDFEFHSTYVRLALWNISSPCFSEVWGWLGVEGKLRRNAKKRTAGGNWCVKALWRKGIEHFEKW